VALPHLIENAGFVAGVDRSNDVVSRAKSRFSRSVAEGEARFLVGRVEELPFNPASFEKILTVNTVYFWDSLEGGSGEMHRVLVPGGSAVVGFLPKEFMDRLGVLTDIFTTRTLGAVVTALERAGFVNVQITRPEMNTAWAVIVANRE
jgi:arsenite methyltransferase